MTARYAMLFYVLKRLGLLGKPEKEDPRRQHIVALNPDDVQNALKKASGPQNIDFDQERISTGAAHDA
ncbi:hypothetical protein ACFSZS_14490 [Seohaeicola zhoushanensis]